MCGDTVVPTSNSSDVHRRIVREPVFDVTMTHRGFGASHPHGVANATKKNTSFHTVKANGMLGFEHRREKRQKLDKSNVPSGEGPVG